MMKLDRASDSNHHCMPFYFSRFSGLLLIFFVHGLVYAILLFQKGLRNRSAAENWLALFLLCSVLYICPWMLGFAGWYDGYECMNCRNFLFYMPLQHTLLMGPAIYFYLSYLLRPGFRFTRKHWLHLLPFFLYIAWCLIVFITDRVVLKKYYLMNGILDPDFDTWYLILGLVSLLFYGVLSLRLYQQYKRFIVEQVSFADDLTFRWVRNFLLAYSIYFFSNLVFHLVQFAGVEVDYIDSWWYYLFFALLFYYIAINGYSNSIQSRVRLRLEKMAEQHPEVIEETSIPVPAALPTEPEPANEEIEKWKLKLEDGMQQQHLYRNPELTLADLAAEMGVHPTLMSRIVNSGFGLNFNDYINRYRVEEVRQRIAGGATEQYTIMSLAYDAGFNSKATFNRAFRKFTGKNPSHFAGGTPS